MILAKIFCSLDNFWFHFRRHFSAEFSDQKIVKLVFNGHVLQPDSKTLRACGLFDNCVVHCLVQNPRPTESAYSNIATNTHASALHNSRNLLNVGGTCCVAVIFEQKLKLINVSGLDNLAPTATTATAATNLSDGRRFIFFGMSLLLLTLLYCWYCR